MGSDDKKISELISQSMRRQLSEEESEAVRENIEQNEEASKFAELSKQINSSVAGLKATTSRKIQLSSDAKSRLSESVAAAVNERLSMTRTGLIGDTANKTPLSEGDSAEGDRKETVGKFQRIRKLAEGGIGAVWLARDEKLGRTVAVKELNDSARESPQAWDRFQREAEITGLLEHPNIVPLYMYGVDRKTAEPFYAMRFVGKRNLANAIEEHFDRVEAGQADTLSLHRLLSVFLDVCQAIAYAHSRGVVHRDLKPENIAIDNFGQVIVLDWGLAKILEDSELALKLNDNCILTDSSLTHTAQGDVIGTPVYMSPEQASGKIDSIDERTDVYGLGTILFSILTGQAPHAKSAAKSNADIDSAIKAIADAPTPRPGELREGVAADLEEICMRAMARKSHLRFDSVTELAEAVEKWIAGQSNKKVEYETLRMEGRELRADMQARVHDLERNVRFCSGLPPIQELIKAQGDDAEIKSWRKRLSVIFEGLMQANPAFQSIVYGRFDGDSCTELVRIERQGPNTTAVRSVPMGRLKTSKQNDFLTKVADKLPGELLTSLVCDPHCELSEDCNEVGLLSGIPVYDEESEEVFGYVMVNCDIYQALEQQLSRRHSATEIVVACDIFHVMGHKVDGQINIETRSKAVAEVVPWFSPAVDHLQTNLDYLDGSTSQIYGARLWFIPDQHGIMYLLKR